MIILHHHIASVEKQSLTTTGCPLVIQCRNFRVVHFVVQRERDCHDVYSSLLRLLRPGDFCCPVSWFLVAVKVSPIFFLMHVHTVL
ncbi:Myotubularin- protein 6 [Xenoophorus captivus]|uniref:Myotubularin- protein 6 n=1 Tax=Xenoophorus captivus TaxID=1517983 RepID=A0ABV0RVS8_9TELE